MDLGERRGRFLSMLDDSRFFFFLFLFLRSHLDTVDTNQYTVRVQGMDHSFDEIGFSFKRRVVPITGQYTDETISQFFSKSVAEGFDDFNGWHISPTGPREPGGTNSRGPSHVYLGY